MDKIKNKTIVTVAPGITISKVKSYLDKSNSVIRTMPNTPLMVGEGMTVVSGEEGISEEKLSFVIGMFEKSGKVIKIKEELIESGYLRRHIDKSSKKKPQKIKLKTM